MVNFLPHLQFLIRTRDICFLGIKVVFGRFYEKVFLFVASVSSRSKFVDVDVLQFFSE